MALMAAVAFKPKASRPPPRGTAGTLGWLRSHLFYSWWSSLLTLVVGYLLVSLLASLYDWGIANAVWEASSRRQCLDTSPHGACWASIGLWFKSFLYGRYPASEHWRIKLSFIASQYIGLFKDTTVVSIVGLYDFLLMLRVPGQNPIWIGLYVEPFVFGGAVYFSLCFAISKYSQLLERRGGSTAGARIRPL